MRLISFKREVRVKQISHKESIKEAVEESTNDHFETKEIEISEENDLELNTENRINNDRFYKTEVPVCSEMCQKVSLYFFLNPNAIWESSLKERNFLDKVELCYKTKNNHIDNIKSKEFQIFKVITKPEK